MARQSVASAAERHSIPKSKEYGGLCSTCNYSTTCIFPRDPKQPVWECEEFEAYAPPPLRVASEPSSRKRAVRGKSSEAQDVGKHLGLCSNCAHLGTCTFPKPEGGIWHCEEYA